jgi:hypothetical protein
MRDYLVLKAKTMPFWDSGLDEKGVTFVQEDGSIDKNMVAVYPAAVLF